MFEDIIVLDENSTNSSKPSSLRGSITHAKNNKFTLDNSSIYYNFENQIIFSTSLLRKYENIIKDRCVPFTIDVEHLYRPEYVSYQLYGTPDLWYLILFVNSMKRPDELNRRDILVFDPSFIGLINSIIEKEKSLVNNSDKPIDVERQLIKELGLPSKRILSKDYDKKIAPLEPPEKPRKLINVTDFNTSFTNSYFPIIRNKLLRKEYLFVDIANKITTLNKEDLTDDMKLEPDCKSGMPLSYKKNYRKDYEGYIYITEDGDYEFKPVMIGNCNLWIDNENIFNEDSENFTIKENYFETQTKNSDFKKGTTEGWKIFDGDLVDDDKIKKKVLKKKYVDVPNVSTLAEFYLDLKNINTYQDLVVTTNYKSIYNKNMLFAGASVQVKYKNGRVETFSNNYWYDFFYNSGNFIDAMVVVTFQKGLELEHVKVYFPVGKKPYYNDVVNGEISISSVKVQPLLYRTVKKQLKGGRWYNYKLRYDMIEQPSSHLQLFWKPLKSTLFTNIPSNILAFTPDAMVRKNNQPYSALTSIYSADERTMFTQSINYDIPFNMDDKNPDPLFVPKNIDYTIKQDVIFNISPTRRYRFECNKLDDVKIYKDGKLWFDMPAGVDMLEKSDPESDKSINVNLQIIYKHKSGNGNASLGIKMNPDDYMNPVWGTFYPKVYYKPGEFLDPWKANSNNISLKPYASGVTNYYFTKTDEMDDYRLKTIINTDSELYYGNVGIIFRMQSEDEYYLYTIRRNVSTEGAQNTLMSGLYKISPRYSEMNMTSDGMFKLRGKLLMPTPQTYTGTETNFVFVMAYHNTIRIYDKYGGQPLIEYTDNESPFLRGSYGFHVFKQAEVNFSDIEVEY